MHIDRRTVPGSAVLHRATRQQGTGRLPIVSSRWSDGSTN